MTTPTPRPPQAPPTVCPYCHAVGTLQMRTEKITRKRRFKFGLLWLLATLLTCGFAFLVWLVMPRYKETTGVNRYTICVSCRNVV